MSAEQNLVVSNASQLLDASRDNLPPARDTPTSARPTKPIKMRNAFGVSEPSPAGPASSQIAAEGKMQKHGGKKSISSQSLSEKPDPDWIEEESSPPRSPPKLDPEPEPVYDAPEEALLPLDVAPDMPTQPQAEEVSITPRHSLPAPFSLVEEPMDTTPVDVELASRKTSVLTQLPEIEILGPSNPTSEREVPFTEPIATRSNSSVVLPLAPLNTPAPPDVMPEAQEPPERTRSLPLPQPVTATTDMPAAPVNPIVAVTDLPPLGTSLSVPNSTLSKVSRRRKMVRRMRKMLLRRRLLNMLLGKELGGITHAQLRQTNEVASTVPVTALT